MTDQRVIGLIAGSGEFPLEIAQSITATGLPVFILGLRGFYDRRLRQFPFTSVDMLDPKNAIAVLRAQNVTDVVLAGGVHRPGPSALLSIYSAYRNRDELTKLLGSGDDTLLRGVVNFLEDHGFQVLGIGSVAPSLLAPLGQIGAIATPPQIQRSVDFAMALLNDLGRYDVGQAVAIAGKRVLAIEGPEGTDAMLARVRDMRASKRVKLGDEPAILVKIAKPQQDRRIDLPAIGPKTIRSLKTAGLAGAVVAAGDVVLVEQNKLISAADNAGIFLMGVNAT